MELQDGNILIIDDDKYVLETARMYLKQKFSCVNIIDNPDDLTNHLKSHDYDVILLDMNFKRGEMDGKEGLFLLQSIKSGNPDISVIMITAYGDVNLAVEAMKEGASDFVLKPWKNEKLYATIMAALELRKSKTKYDRLKRVHEKVAKDIEKGFKDFIGDSPAINRVKDLISKVAETDANVLILGENGTGKELVARALHRLSHRNQEVFIRIDLGAIAETLFESELFGHVRGAFTDAKSERAGCFELADKGTLFLDEIGNLTLPLQAKLLTVIQNRLVRRVGSNKSVSVDVRLITATNMPLYAMAEKERPEFRKDLLYRINTVEIQVPPLRERPEDIPLLIDHYLKVYGRKYGKLNLKMDGNLLKRSKSYTWPGNVRELQHTIEKSIILSEKGKITEEIFFTRNTIDDTHEPVTLERMEKKMIERSIEKNAGNLTKVANELGITRATLYRKIEKFGI